MWLSENSECDFKLDIYSLHPWESKATANSQRGFFDFFHNLNFYRTENMKKETEYLKAESWDKVNKCHLQTVC